MECFYDLETILTLKLNYLHRINFLMQQQLTEFQHIHTNSILLHGFLKRLDESRGCIRSWYVSARVCFISCHYLTDRTNRLGMSVLREALGPGTQISSCHITKEQAVLLGFKPIYQPTGLGCNPADVVKTLPPFVLQERHRCIYEDHKGGRDICIYK